MNARTILLVVAVAAFAFVATNCLAATVDVNKPCDANKPAEKKSTIISIVDFSKYTEGEKSKGCDKDPNKKGCDKDPNKATIISASDFGTLAKDANKTDVNKPAEPNKSKMAASEKGTEKGKGHDKGKAKGKDQDKDANKPADSNKPAEKKSTIISASDFGNFAKECNDVNKPAEPKKDKMCAVSETVKGCDKDKDANKPADPNCKK